MNPGFVRSCLALLALSLAFAGADPARAQKRSKTPAPEPARPVFDEKLFESMKFRSIGPFRGGRSTAVAGIAGDHRTFYMGSTGGGVWKTEDAGLSWKNISDEDLGAGSIGAVAVAPSDPNVIWAGTGSACPRGNVSPGDGVYRSTDGGESWSHAGLPEAGQIGRIRVHPDDPDTAWVAALGHIFGPNDERGVFRTRDGGKTWEKVLFVSDRAGAVDLALDPNNPRILYAAIWQVERKPWTLESGGEDSGLWRSKDGGDTWQELTAGLPSGVVGRIGVSASGAKPGRVYALVEAEDGGLFRSDDGGQRFRKINTDRNYRQRAWYYTHVYADPVDPETVYILNTGLYRSHDAGKEFEFIRAPHGDQHDLWIDPSDPRVLINANDGGANVSFNGGASWTTQANQPTAEMYRVTVDGRFPYFVYGCQQDNSCVALPSRTSSGSIGREDWYVIGGCESGHVAVDPRDPNVTYSGCYGGSIERYDHSTGQAREINLYPQMAIGQAASDLRYRFQWNAPIRLSPHDPDVLYHASQHVHRSRDAGQSWETISPDLSHDDESTQGYAGGPITWDNTGVEVYGTVFAFEESPHAPGLLWAGTDDGRVHLSRDAGGSWNEISPAAMPERGQVNMIELSAHDPGRAFLAVTRYRIDDFTPYIFRTDDYGASWTRIADGSRGIPAGHFVRVVREDPKRRGLLFAGTEFGLYVSFDDGAAWQPLQRNLPVTPVTDLAVASGDLVVATQGRSFWILDDLSPLRQLTAEAAAAPVHLFTPRDAVRFGGGFSFGGGDGGQNPPSGVVIHYLLAEGPSDGDSDNGEDGEETGEVGEEAATEPAPALTLEILDAEGGVLRTLSSAKPEYRAPSPFARFFPEAGRDRKLPAKKGLNRYVWNFRLGDAKLVDEAVLWGSARGPRVPPGTYRARLSRGDWSETASFRMIGDPRLATTQEDYDAQFELAKEIWQALADSHQALSKLRSIGRQVKGLTARMDEAGMGEGLDEAAKAVHEKLEAIEAKLHQKKAESSQDVLNFPPRLDNQIVALLGAVGGGDAAPTDGARERFADLRAELDALVAELDAVVSGELAAFNQKVEAAAPPPVIVPSS